MVIWTIKRGYNLHNKTIQNSPHKPVNGVSQIFRQSLQFDGLLFSLCLKTGSNWLCFFWSQSFRGSVLVKVCFGQRITQTSKHFDPLYFWTNLLQNYEKEVIFHFNWLTLLFIFQIKITHTQNKTKSTFHNNKKKKRRKTTLVNKINQTIY